MNKILIVVLITLATLTLAAHSRAEQKIPMPTVTFTASEPKPQLLSFVGTIEFVKLEGGFYGIVAKDGKKYMPVNLDKKYQKHGLKIKCQVAQRPELVTTQMWGQAVEIKHIKKQ
jgi:hypothetical protein